MIRTYESRRILVILSEAKDLFHLILQMLRRVYPEPQLQALRSAQGDSEGLSMTAPVQHTRRYGVATG